MASRPNTFAAVPGALDRCEPGRRDEAFLAAARADPASRLVPLVGDEVAVTADGSALLLPLDAVPPAGARTLLGTRGGVAVFAAELAEPPATLPEGTRFATLRDVVALLPAADANLLAYASALATWHRRHRFCAVCGSPTDLEWAGHRLVCTGAVCAALHFPRTDPVVIMLVTEGDACLLGRSPGWPEGSYSALAGFVEPGESLEDAVAREVDEEVGVAVEDVEYHSSQPWPFPASLMVGFTARARARELHVDRHELADARWVTRRQLDDGEVRVPPAHSIAARLIGDWRSSG